MRRGRGHTAVAALAIAVAAAPAAHASQGSDAVTRGDYVSYTADPGEANRLTLDDTSQGLHLRDTGAIIRWTSVPVPGLANCAGGVHDVYCTNQGGFDIFASLGDGNDTFANSSSFAATVDLGAGNDSAVGGGHGYSLEGGPGADDLHGGPRDPDRGGMTGEQVTYEHSTGPVNVSADNAANDGAAGEGDNVHSDVHEVIGSAFGDTITGFSADGGAGDDTIVGSSGDDATLYGGDGNDSIEGGGGSDVMGDWSGDNTFYARDGVADHIYCGTGHDTVYADPQDIIETPPAYGGPCDDVQVAP
jgi:Ca2+-binding RTX toxin-like protein